MAFDKVSHHPSFGSKGRLAVCALIAASLTLAACDQSEKTRAVMDQRAAEAQQSMDSTRKVEHPVIYDPLTVSSKVWSGGTALRMQRGMPLPAKFEGEHGITLVSADPMSLSDIANAISAQTGIPIRLSALSVPAKSSSSAAAAAAVTAGNTPPPATFGAMPNAGGSLPPTNLNGGSLSGGVGLGVGSTSSSSSTPTAISSPDLQMPISYEGSLSGLLERISAYFGINWRYDGSSVSISRYETRIFVIEALPGTQEVNEGMQDDTSNGNSGVGSSSGSSGSSSSGSSSGTSSGSQNTLTQNSKTTMDFKYWDELNQVLNSIVGGQGSVVVSPTMGTITITTTPDVMETVSDYVNKENKRLSRQIAINVQIYSVNLGQSEDFSIAFTAFLKNLTKFSGLNYTSASAPGIANSALTSSNFGALSVAILNGPNDPTAHAGDVFNALSTIGDTSNVAQFPMTTLNNHPVSRRVGTDTNYLQTINQTTNTSTTTGTAPTITTPVIATIHDGFSIQLTPRLLDDGRILLQYSLSLIGIDTLGQTAFNTGTGTVPLDLPVTDNRIFVQQSLLRSGSTLIIGGVDQEKLTQNNQGVVSPDNFLLGGGVSSSTSHFMMFMAITPQVMDVGDTGEHN